MARVALKAEAAQFGELESVVSRLQQTQFYVVCQIISLFVLVAHYRSYMFSIASTSN
jgi:hypothetical protein